MYEIFKFELNYRLKRPETYLFFFFLFLFSLFGVEFVFQGVELGLVKKNSPMVIAKTMGAITGLSMLIASMIMGVPVLRDFQYNIESLIYVNPISKKDYFFGRYFGSLVVLLFIFCGVLMGMMLGEFMPWINSNEYLSFHFINYLQPFLWVAMPIVLFGASVFFVTGALSKNMMVVYTQGIIIFVLFMLTKAITNETLQSILDPFSLTTLSQVGKQWNVSDRNISLIPFTGAMLYNKLFWTAIGLTILAFGYKKLRLNVVPKTASKNRKKESKEIKIDVSDFSKTIPLITPVFGLKALFTQLLLNAWFHAKLILKQTSFWAIAICGFIIIIINSVNLGTVHGVDSYPTTYLIIEELQEMSAYFFIIILVFYSAEIMWKEKEAKLHLIYDSTPSNSFVNLTAKALGLMIVYAILIFSLILTGILFQASSGYFRFELGVYFSGFFLEVLPFLVLYTFVSIFFQALFGSKYLGILATLVFFIVNLAISIFGIDHVLLNFGGNALGSYSDMNGYGHFLKPFLWVKAYWFFFGILLLIISSMMMVRGSESQLRKRWRIGQKQVGKSFRLFTMANILLLIATGSFIFYNTNVLNEFWTTSEKQNFRVEYENTLKPFEYQIQPKIVDINLNVALYPSQRSYQAKGSYTLTNINAEPIKEIHVQKLIDNHVYLDSVQFDRAVIVDNSHEKFHYTIYKLKQPLMEGDSMKMDFIQTFSPAGFESNDSNTDVVYNGTFFDNGVLPSFGYRRKYELTDEDERKNFELLPRITKATQDDKRELVNARTGSDSDGVTLEMIISTEAPQTGITSGDLIRKWSEGNRNYFHYKSKKPIINFYSIVSAEYEVMRDSCKPSGNTESDLVDLEIYYQKGHEYNLDRMMESMKKSLDYYSTHFSPYQYRQMRIMEFPRNRTFAQSFPNAVPFSEALGFIMDIDDEEDVDMVFFITAHELAHQWWGLQLEAANVQGRNMILETLAQYSALMVLKERYGEEKVQQFLQQQHEDYLEGNRRMHEEEPSLAMVEKEGHIYYAKGAINMYEFQKHIGENNVNLALRDFLNDWRSFDNPNKPRRYATTQDLLGYFKEVTPDSLQYVIAELFESSDCVDFEI